jgi:multiple sugar transport system permease protein
VLAHQRTLLSEPYAAPVRRRRLSGALPYVLVAPTALLVGVLILYPMGRGLLVSLYDSRNLIPRPEEFAGFVNYARLLHLPELANALRVTTLYTLGTVVLSLAIGMGCALLLQASFPGRGLARAMLTIPWGTPLVASALIWYWMYDPQYGLVNFALRSMGVIHGNVSWLLSPQWALSAVVLVDVWRIFPFGAVVLLTALSGVDQSMYDSARVDGAGPVITFFRITLPNIRPTVMILLLLFTIWSLKRFDTVWIMTQGGPADRTNVLAVEIYREAFRNFHVGIASAIAMIGVALSVLATIVYFALEGRVDLKVS